MFVSTVQDPSSLEHAQAVSRDLSEKKPKKGSKKGLSEELIAMHSIPDKSKVRYMYVYLHVPYSRKFYRKGT